MSEVTINPEQPTDSVEQETEYQRFLREQEESKNPSQPSGGLGTDSFEYKSPTKEENEASGATNPITATEQANQAVTTAITSPVQKTLNFANRALQGGDYVDLKKAMNMPPGEERDAELDRIFQQKYGKTFEEFKQANLLQNTWDGFKNQGAAAGGIGAAAGMGVIDFPIDVIGNLPGGEYIDEQWDKHTKFENPILQSVRKLSNIVVPTLIGSKYISANVSPTISASSMPSLAKSLANVGAYGALDVGVIGLSDVGEDDNAARALVDFFPEVFGPDGSIPLPDFLVTLDGDSPSVRKMKNMWEAGALALPTNILGYWLQAGKPTLRWYNPLDETAKQYKNAQISLNASDDTLRQIAEIDTVLESGKATSKQKSALYAQRGVLVEDLQSSGTIEDYISKADDSVQTQVDDIATRKLNNSPDEVDWDLDVYGDGGAKQSVPSANVARNMADTTAIKTGDVTGTPNPVITEADKASTARETVLGIAEEAENAGKFNAVIDGFKYSNKDMNNAAWKIYKSIIHADNIDDVKNLFLNNKRILEIGDGAFRANYANADQYEAALFGIRDLANRYLGRGIMQSSARVMDTLGREVADIAESANKFKGLIDEDSTIDLMLDKLDYLMAEVGLNRHISKFQFGQLDNWTKAIKTAEDPQPVINQLLDHFEEVEASIQLKTTTFTETLRNLQKENPLALKPFLAEFERTGGDVDTIAKLMKWAEDNVSPGGMIVSPDPSRLNLFAKGMWSVGFNNVLSGLAAGRAFIGNTYNLIAKPTTAISSGIIEGVFKDGSFNSLKKSLYYYGGIGETNKRALKAGWNAIKKSWKDPDALIGSMRKDMVVSEQRDWFTAEDLRQQWVLKGDTGKIMQYDLSRLLYDFSRWRVNRVGMTFLNAADAMLDTTMATLVSRMDAYDEVFKKFGEVTPDLLAAAEKKHYLTKFDKSGRLSDSVVEALGGEIKLNLDDGLATEINRTVTKFPFLKPLFMFPRTLSNDFKLALSWTPLQMIPGINKYSKTIWAQTQDEIAEALMEHGIDMATTPNAMTIFKHLQDDYKGRMAFSGLTVAGLFQYAMAGNVRGNGSHRPGQRKYERDNFGYESKTIKFPIPGKDNDIWVSYEGMPIEPMLTVLGDMAYYARDLNQPMMEDIMNKLVWTMSATFFSDNALNGLEPVIAFLNGDLSWFNRLAANTTRIFLPMSGAAGVLSKAIDSTQKDIHNNMMHYIINRTPVLSTGLPKQVDIWTGQYVNDIHNPILRIINAISPIQVSGTDEPWRKDLRDMGYNVSSILKKDSTGSYEYKGSEREYINKLVGDQQIYKKVQKLLKSKKYQDQIGKLRALRASGEEMDWDYVDIKARPPLFQEIDRIVREAQAIAELTMLQDRPDIINAITHQKLVNKYIKQGRIDDARSLGNKSNRAVENLLQIRK